MVPAIPDFGFGSTHAAGIIIHLGDAIYANRDWRATELEEFWGKYKADRMDPPTRRLLSETSLYVTWDDHEVEDNYCGNHPLAKIDQRAFFDYWPVRRDPRDRFGLYRSFRWGRADELFILDTRQYRDPPTKTMLGKEQKDCVLDSLAASRSRFKIIAMSVPVIASGRDRWAGYSEERDGILRFIGEKKLPALNFSPPTFTARR